MNCKDNNLTDDYLADVADTNKKLVDKLYEIINENINQDNFEIIIEIADTLITDEII